MSKELSNYSDAELQAEIKRRAEERRKAAIRERHEHNESVVKVVAHLVPLFKHTKKGCKDETYPNALGGCDRCTALSIADTQHMDSDYVLHISFERNPLPDEDDFHR